MARYFGIPFAVLGDRIAVPDATQPDGSVSFSQGFGFDYERENTEPAYKPVPREQTNALYHDITEAIGVLQKQGAPDWTANAMPYSINAQVRHIDSNWSSRIDNNNDTPGSGTNWVKVGPKGQLIGVRRFTANGTYTPTIGTQSVLVEVQAGGGGSGGVPASVGAGAGAASSGGGAGGYASSYLETGFSGATMTIGSGGNGGGAGSTTGGNGGSSSFGALLSASGGTGGSPGIVSTNTTIAWPAAMGTGTNGNVRNLNGTYGMHGISAGAAGQFVGSGGGDASLGAGGPGAGANAAGQPGTGFGGGGGGVSCNTASSPAARAGAAGAPGVIIVWEYA